MAWGERDVVGPTWRVTGWRLWLCVLLMVLFVLQAVLRLVDARNDPPLGYGDGILIFVWTAGALAYGALVAPYARSRVTLLADGVEIRSLRRRVVRYADIDPAYRSRWSRGSVTLDLLDANKVVLPAPVAGLKDPAPELDEAVEMLNVRVAAARPDVGDGAPG